MKIKGLAEVSMLVVLAACSNNVSQTSHADIDATTFDAWRQSPNVLVLDVRTPDEYAAGHVDGALNVDYYSPDFEQQLKNLPKKDTVLVYCASGRRSSNSVDALKKAGFSYIANLEGGYSNYIRQ
ncbi:MAG: rhodanese-like domain-containing protein [Thermaurantimonas sp.]|uniref:rhodanese-like domain-containing protein n=1 Tax=Thermaurantimonas sp. TaxID=2681568 RepID=UPI00391D0CA8